MTIKGKQITTACEKKLNSFLASQYNHLPQEQQTLAKEIARYTIYALWSSPEVANNLTQLKQLLKQHGLDIPQTQSSKDLMGSQGVELTRIQDDYKSKNKPKV